MVLDRRSFCRTLLAAGASAIPMRASIALAGAYPDKAVTLVVSFAAGGMTDIVGRMVGTELSKALRQPFVVDNRPGAAGRVGTEYVARKSPDGYTLLVSATGHVIGPAVQKVNYKPVEDFVPIAILARAPNILLVNKSVPASNLSELIAWAKTQPQVPYGSAGVGGSTHLAGETFRRMTGLPLAHVAYRGAAPAITDLVAGQINMAFQDSMSAAPFIKNGDLKPIAVTTLKRSPLFPDVPTLNESGFKDFDLYTWLGLYAPAGTSSDIVKLLNREANRALAVQKTIDWLRENNCEPGGDMDPMQFATYVAQETKKWQEVVAASGVKVE